MRLYAFSLAFVCLPVPEVAQACDRWELTGEYTLRQSNGIDVALNLVRSGDKLSGQARFYSSQFGHDIAGPLEGYVDSDRFHFRVAWYLLNETCLKYYGIIPISCWTDKYDENGLYEGVISDRGEVSGSNYPFERPHAKTSWFLKRDVECAAAPAPASPPIIFIPPPAPITPGDAGRTPVFMPQVLSNVGRCKSGYVWRETTREDRVCVTPESRERARLENSTASLRVDPTGAYGPNTCKAGFVWREAFSGDVVCVTPEVRSLVREENAQASMRRL